MLWQLIIIDGIVLSIVFCVTVALMWLKMPNAMSKMMPAEIRRAAPKRSKKEVATLYTVLFLLYGLMLACVVISARMKGVTGFWNLFWTGYAVTFIVNMADFWILDLWFRKKFKARIMIKGTEKCKAWETKEWLKTLALVEHWIMWPLVACPMIGVLVAGVGELLSQIE